MANTSATGGYLLPGATSPPLQDADLDALIQKVVVGLTGLPGSLVRPRWQPVVPKQPDPGTDWCAIGVTVLDDDDYPSLEHDGAGDGQDQFSKHETIEVLASFYGPYAGTYAAQFRDGLYVPQNREALIAANLSLLDAGRVVPAPELVNQQWVRRFDVDLRLRRKVERTYPVLNLLSAATVIDTDTHS